ncbi:MAG: hypothetical protein ACLQVL_06170 [Terriglobia bacterium]
MALTSKRKMTEMSSPAPPRRNLCENRSAAILAVLGTGSRSCERTKEKAKTHHAKAQRRKGNQAIILCDLCILAPLRETVYFFSPSDARATYGANGVTKCGSP